MAMTAIPTAESMDTFHNAIASVSLFSSSLSHSIVADAAQAMAPTPTAEGALGRDIFTFLIVSVIVVPLCKSFKITPVLGFLLVGCAIGPYGLHMFSNNEADIELGDFGILFLLFNEGLSLSPGEIAHSVVRSLTILCSGFFFIVAWECIGCHSPPINWFHYSISLSLVTQNESRNLADLLV
jgi:hypothetical protein